MENAPVSQPNSGVRIPVGFACNCSRDPYTPDLQTRTASVAADTVDDRFSYLSHIQLEVNGTVKNIYFNADQTPYEYNTTGGDAALNALRTRYNEMLAGYLDATGNDAPGDASISQADPAVADLVFSVTTDENKVLAVSVVANGTATNYA